MQEDNDHQRRFHIDKCLRSHIQGNLGQNSQEGYREPDGLSTSQVSSFSGNTQSESSQYDQSKVSPMSRSTRASPSELLHSDQFAEGSRTPDSKTIVDVKANTFEYPGKSRTLITVLFVVSVSFGVSSILGALSFFNVHIPKGQAPGLKALESSQTPRTSHTSRRSPPSTAVGPTDLSMAHSTDHTRSSPTTTRSIERSYGSESSTVDSLQKTDSRPMTTSTSSDGNAKRSLIDTHMVTSTFILPAAVSYLDTKRRAIQSGSEWNTEIKPRVHDLVPTSTTSAGVTNMTTSSVSYQKSVSSRTTVHWLYTTLWAIMTFSGAVRSTNPTTALATMYSSPIVTIALADPLTVADTKRGFKVPVPSVLKDPIGVANSVGNHAKTQVQEHASSVLNEATKALDHMSVDIRVPFKSFTHFPIGNEYVNSPSQQSSGDQGRSVRWLAIASFTMSIAFGMPAFAMAIFAAILYSKYKKKWNELEKLRDDVQEKIENIKHTVTEKVMEVTHGIEGKLMGGMNKFQDELADHLDALNKIPGLKIDFGDFRKKPGRRGNPQDSIDSVERARATPTVTQVVYLASLPSTYHPSPTSPEMYAYGTAMSSGVPTVMADLISGQISSYPTSPPNTGTTSVNDAPSTTINPTMTSNATSGASRSLMLPFPFLLWAGRGQKRLPKLDATSVNAYSSISWWSPSKGSFPLLEMIPPRCLTAYSSTTSDMVEANVDNGKTGKPNPDRFTITARLCNKSDHTEIKHGLATYSLCQDLGLLEVGRLEHGGQGKAIKSDGFQPR